jgi:hypothetical protein
MFSFLLDLDYPINIFSLMQIVYHYLERQADNEAGVQTITIEKKYMHPKYDTPDRKVI